MAMNVGLPQISLDLVSEKEASLDAGQMNNGDNFRVEIPSVVSVPEVPMVV